MRKVVVAGDLPVIIENREGVYQDNLRFYFWILFRQMGNNNSYHNFGHICHVLWVCYKSLQHPAYRKKISKRQGRNLLIAAMFHDFGHSGSPISDENEIERAIDALGHSLLAIDRPHFDNIANLIRATRFPHEKTKGFPLGAMILREADLTQSLSPIWMQQVIFGLSKEMRLTPIEVLKKQEGFLCGLSFKTAWVKDMFSSKMILNKIKETQDLLALLK